MMNMAERLSAHPTMSSHSLICAPRVIWLWPGIALTYERGRQIQAVARSTILQAAAMLHGPDANFSRIVPAVERAVRLLNVGEVNLAQKELDRSALPPLSVDGVELAQAVCRRLGIVQPAFQRNFHSSRRWSGEDIELFARGFDRYAATARELEKAFSVGAWNPDKHPRWPAGQSDGGEFKTVDASEIIAHLTPIADDGPAQVQINRDRHEKAVAAEVKKYRDAGFIVVERVRFFVPSAGFGTEVDFVVSTPGFPLPNPLFAVDVKTGGGDLTDNQRVIYPRLEAGIDVVPRGWAAFCAGFIPGERATVTLRVDVKRVALSPNDDVKKFFSINKISADPVMPSHLCSPIIQNVQDILMTEGFEKPTANMQIRPFDKEWRGWICLLPSRSIIELKTGIFSTVVRDAVYDVGKPIYANPYVKIRKYRIGPPNVMLPLSFLVDPDPRSQTKMPWYDVTDRDPDWVRDQLLHAIRNYAYPFFERTLTYEALLEAAMRYGTLNHAQQFSTPVLMMLTGRRVQLQNFVELCISHMSNEGADEYRRYIAGLEPYLASKGLLPP